MEFNTEIEKKLWRESTFVFDTSALLDIYFYSDHIIKEILNSLASTHQKCFIPNQVFNEYNRHRRSKITAPKTRYDQLLLKIDGNKDSGHVNKIENCLGEIKGLLKALIEETKNPEKHPFINTKVIEDFSNKIDDVEGSFMLFKNKIYTEVEKQKNLFDDKANNDALLNFIESKFIIGKDYTFNKLITIAKEGLERYELEIPPGYMDAKGRVSKIGIQKFGDLIIWKQIIDYAKDNASPVVFVINDVKEDWCITNLNDKFSIEQPREELLKEFSDETNQKIWFYTMKQFLYKSKTLLKTKISQVVIDEVGKVGSSLNALKEFNSIFGLDEESTYEDVKAIFGTPAKYEVLDDSFAFNSLIYGNDTITELGITINKDSNKIYTIRINEYTPLLLYKHNILDKKLQYIGKHISELQQIFGVAKEIHAGNHIYKYDDKLVNFICYEFNHEKCSEIEIYWFRK